MKKIIVISGSPRKNGDTSKVVKQIVEQMSSKADIQFEYIFLREQNLEFCKGCMQCMSKGEEKCPIKDDAPALIISSTELSGLGETMKYMAFPIRCWGFSLIDKIGIISDAFKVEGAYREKILSKIDNAVKRYIEYLNSPSLKKPDLAAVQFLNKLKTKIIIHREKLPYDYEYWKQKGWLDKQFFYETQINPIKRFFGGLPVIIIKLVMKKKVGPEVFSKMFTEPLTAFSKESAK
jgi:hypothetical protein